MRKLTILIALAVLLAACTSTPTPPTTSRQVTLFYTSDEHGYLEPLEEDDITFAGATGLLARLRQEGYEPDSSDALLLSGGDMWTGPAISTWFAGASAVEVFNQLGYDAAALGNHDFDFGQGTLVTHGAAAEFPFLSANLAQAGSGAPPAFVQPTAIREVSGVSVGIVGLSLQTTPLIVMPANTVGLSFGDYEAALRETVPQVRAEGADVIVVIAHVCPSDLLLLTPVAAELGVSVLAGGHCHQSTTQERDGVLVIGAGQHWEAFVRVDLTYDTVSGQVVTREARAVENRYRTAEGDPVTPDPQIAQTVAGWAARTDEALGEVIGVTSSGIELDWPLYNLVTDAWRWYYPQADLAISNLGGFREAIPPGEIALSDVVAVLPFDNTLVDVELTGEQVLANLRACGGVASGMTVSGSAAALSATLDDGSPLDPQATYHVLVNSFIYQGGDGCLFYQHDPNAYDTGVHWRDPVIEWIRAQQTSAEHPLESLLDNTARGPEW